MILSLAVHTVPRVALLSLIASAVEGSENTAAQRSLL